MAMLQVRLPDDLKDFIDGQVASGMYPSAAELLRDLLLWHKRQTEDLAMRNHILNRTSGHGRNGKKEIEAAWANVHETRRKELVAEIRKGEDQLDRGKFFSYHSVEECLEDIKAEAKKLSRPKRRKTA